MKRYNSGFAHIGLIFLLFLTVVGVYVAYRKLHTDTSNNQTQDVQHPPKTPFSFTAAGDFGDGDEADAVLRAIAAVKSDFTLALGDLGYGGNGAEPAWCQFVKDRVGNDHPFELIAGNHDDGTSDGDITEYTKCLPNRIGNLTGNYGTEYSFDYNNLARFILISPDINNYGHDYATGSEHLKWLSDSIDDARKTGMDWVIVGMHKNCITPGVKTCEIGEDLINTLVDLKVDIVLQGHEHAYFRSKQLALNPETCPAIIANTYSADCVTKEGNQLVKGDGTVIVISGAGGYTLRDVNFEDAEYNYFEAVNGSNSSGSYGFSQFNVSADTLQASFTPAVGSFTDAFTISTK